MGLPTEENTMSTTTTTPFRKLDGAGNLRDNDVKAYYLEDLKRRVAVARVGGKLYAFDDIYESCPLSAGLLTGTTLMSQWDGSQFDVTTGRVLRGPATVPLATYEVREQDGAIQAWVIAATTVVVAVFDSHDQVDAAVKALGKAGFDMKHLSVVGKDYHSEEQVVGFYNAGDRVKFWGKRGLFWGGLWGVLFSSAFLVIPVVGHVIVLGALGSALVSGAAGAAVGGGLTALGAAMYSIGIPRDSIVEYETALKADKFLLVVHGTPAEVLGARDLLGKLGAVSVDTHGTSVVSAKSDS
jgi:nitrite reductase/ring-hydroxylating ferredoxin subunit